MAKFFSSNSTAYDRSIHGVSNNRKSTSDIQTLRDFYKLQILNKNVFSNLNILLGYYNDGDYESIEKLLSNTEKTLLMNINSKELYNTSDINTLYNFKYDATLFANYQKSTLNILNGLTAAVINDKVQLKYETELSTLTKYKESIESSDINNVLTLITTELNEKKVNINPIDISVTLPPLTFELKPWYTRYFVLYGAPTTSFFDLDKLQQIVYDLIDENVITLEDFTRTL
jgi:hypothetical protein